MVLNAWQKEWNRMQRMEYAYIHKGRFKKNSKMTAFLSKKIPENMQNKLNKAFAKAFEIIFEKGTFISFFSLMIYAFPAKPATFYWVWIMSF